VIDLPVHSFRGRDGAGLVYRELGQGRALVLIHGFFSTAKVNWLRPGQGATLAARGHRVILPDLRGHGDSAKSHDAAAYPPDVLADDGFALIEHLGLTDYDLGGYSLGGRTVMRMLVRGAAARRAVVAGVGLDEVVHTATRGVHFHRVLTHPGTFERGSPEWRAEAFLKQVGGDRDALLHVLGTQVDTPREALARIDTPTLVVVGAEDDRSAEALAAALPRARYAVVPGNHMSAVTQPELGAVIADFLGDRAPA
jgi:pimeloyl-ACP methyl ester carboxylesterase